MLARKVFNLSSHPSPSCSFHCQYYWMDESPIHVSISTRVSLKGHTQFLSSLLVFYFVPLNIIPSLKELIWSTRRQIFLGGRTEALRFVAVFFCPCCICPALADPCELPRGQERLQTRCEWRVLSSNGTNRVCCPPTPPSAPSPPPPLLPPLPPMDLKMQLLW